LAYDSAAFFNIAHADSLTIFRTLNAEAAGPVKGQFRSIFLEYLFIESMLKKSPNLQTLFQKFYISVVDFDKYISSISLNQMLLSLDKLVCYDRKLNQEKKDWDHE